jgi:hypothetical protein
LPTIQTDLVFEFNIADKPGSLSALRPYFLVIPNATSAELLRSGCALKKVVSKGLAPGQPASI